MIKKQSQEMLYGQTNVDIGFLKNGRTLMTYFDVDQDGYRTASDTWTIGL